MLLDQATPRNVSRAMKEINAFEWEGDFKPMARQALKELLENRLDQEMAQYLGVSRYEHASDRHDYRNGHYLRHLLTEMGDIELLVPRSRKGKFPSKLFERYARRCRSVDRGVVGVFLFRAVHAQSRLGAGSGAGRESLGLHDFAHRAGFGPRGQPLSRSYAQGSIPLSLLRWRGLKEQGSGQGPKEDLTLCLWHHDGRPP